MKIDEIRQLSDQEIHSHINDAREELMNFRFQMATSGLPDYTRLRHTRRLIARLETILREQIGRAHV